MRSVAFLSLSTLTFGTLTYPALAAPTPNFGTGECAQVVTALSGSVTREGDFCLVAIKGPVVSSGTSGTWIPPEGVTSVDILLVGGGGSGGRGSGNAWDSAGGGGGAMYESTGVAVVPGQSVAVTVGSGGLVPSSAGAGSVGSPSSFGTLVAQGGGGGGALMSQSSGGSVVGSVSPGGSGGGSISSPVGPAQGLLGADGTSNDKQLPKTDGSAAGAAGLGSRNSGGDSNAIFVSLSDGKAGAPPTGMSLSIWLGSGGGGAGTVGGDIQWVSSGTVGSTSFKPGTGGAGLPSTLLSASSASALEVGEVLNSEVYFAGGGGGRANYASTGVNTSWASGSLSGDAGVGGGGGLGFPRTVNGASTSGHSNNGFANTGGGGKGFASGGSGIVVIRYSIDTTAPVITGNNSVSVTTPSTAVATYTASESEITWGLSGADAELFDISSTGVITFKTASTTGTYVITVEATDASENKGTLEVTVTVSAAASPRPSVPPSSSDSVTVPTSQEPVRTVVRGFAANSTKLTKEMRKEIRGFLRANPSLNQVACRGFTSAPVTVQDRALARDRGRVTCNLIKKLRPEATITVLSGSHNEKRGAQIRRVKITLR